jgi:hypothetical protein
MSSDQLLTISEVAEYAGKSRAAVKWNIDHDKFPHAEKVVVSKAREGKEATYKWLIPMTDVLAVWPQAAPKQPDDEPAATSVVTLSLDEFVALKETAAKMTAAEAETARLIKQLDDLTSVMKAISSTATEPADTDDVIDITDPPAEDTLDLRIKELEAGGWRDRRLAKKLKRSTSASSG